MHDPLGPSALHSGRSLSCFRFDRYSMQDKADLTSYNMQHDRFSVQLYHAAQLVCSGTLRRSWTSCSRSWRTTLFGAIVRQSLLCRLDSHRPAQHGPELAPPKSITWWHSGKERDCPKCPALKQSFLPPMLVKGRAVGREGMLRHYRRPTSLARELLFKFPLERLIPAVERVVRIPERLAPK